MIRKNARQLKKWNQLLAVAGAEREKATAAKEMKSFNENDLLKELMRKPNEQIAGYNARVCPLVQQHGSTLIGGLLAEERVKKLRQQCNPPFTYLKDQIQHASGVFDDVARTLRGKEDAERKLRQAREKLRLHTDKLSQIPQQLSIRLGLISEHLQKK